MQARNKLQVVSMIVREEQQLKYCIDSGFGEKPLIHSSSKEMVEHRAKDSKESQSVFSNQAVNT